MSFYTNILTVKKYFIKIIALSLTLSCKKQEKESKIFSLYNFLFRVQFDAWAIKNEKFRAEYVHLNLVYIIDTQDMSKVANIRNPALRVSVKSRKISRGLGRRL